MAHELKIYNGLDVDNKDIININGINSILMTDIRGAHNKINANVSQEDLDLIENNILLNAFRIASEESLSILNFMDGIADEYIDETGVDTGSSTNQIYNSGSNYYSPINYQDVKLLLHLNGTDGDTSTTDDSPFARTISFFGNAQLDDAEKQFGTTSCFFDGTTDYLRASDSSDWDIFGSTLTNYTIDCFFKLFATGGTDTFCGQYQGPSGNNEYWVFRVLSAGQIDIRLVGAGGSALITCTSATGIISDTNWHHVALVKKADEYGVYVDGVQVAYVQDTSTRTFSAPLIIGSLSGTMDAGAEFHGWLDEFRIAKSNIFNASPNVGLSDTIIVPNSESVAGITNMTLISEGFTATAQPETGRIVIAEEDVDSITLNTDLKGYLSRDDGSTWEEVTLENVGGIEDNKKILTGLFDFATGTPSGTDVRYKIETLNNKNLKIHATGLFWE